MPKFKECWECEMPHYTDCPDCLGFGLVSKDGFKSLYPIDADEAHAGITLEHDQVLKTCPTCHSTIEGLPEEAYRK